MATQAEDRTYELVIWDYDAAPDACDYREENGIAPYYVYRRLCGLTLRDATPKAYRAVEEYPYFVGAAVFQNGQKVRGYGLTFAYPKKGGVS